MEGRIKDGHRVLHRAMLGAALKTRPLALPEMLTFAHPPERVAPEAESAAELRAYCGMQHIHVV